MGSSSSKSSGEYSLYIALYEGPPGQRHHCGLIIGPKGSKTSEGDFYHAVIDTQGSEVIWNIEHQRLKRATSKRFLVRMVIGEVRDRKRLEKVLENTPPPHYPDRCRHWAGDAYGAACLDRKALRNDAGTWQNIYDVAYQQASSRGANQTRPATYDMLKHMWIVD